jgi:pyruvate/2-oxoacid:ferredoxin oxidoreductase beta subunit
VEEFLSTQGRFAYLSEERIAQVQRHIDERWELLGRLEAAGE